jgi:hypothetical protein
MWWLDGLNTWFTATTAFIPTDVKAGIILALPLIVVIHTTIRACFDKYERGSDD